MKQHLSLVILAGVFGAVLMPGLQAADAGSNEARLREALRSALIQARTAENDRAVSEADKAELKAKNETLAKQVEALTKQSRIDKEKADKAATELSARASEQAAQVGQLKQELEKTKGDLRKSTDEAHATEAARVKLASEAILLQRTIADQKTRNREMFKLGSEILTRYEKFGLGEALGAKEPFVGLTRVKLQNFVQDYQDKLTDQRIAR